MFVSIPREFLVPTLTVQVVVYAQITAFVLLSVVAVGTHEAILGYLGFVSPNMLRVLASAGVAGMQGAVSSPLIVAPGVTGGFTGTQAGAGNPGLLVLALSNMAITAAIVIAIAVASTDTAAKIVNIRTQRLFLCDEVWAGPVTWFPDLYAVLATHVESLILCAEVRTGDVGGAVFIAEAISVFNIDS